MRIRKHGAVFSAVLVILDGSEACINSVREGRRSDQTTFIINPFVAELFVSIFRHLKLELLTQFPDSNDEKILLFMDIDISQN